MHSVRGEPRNKALEYDVISRGIDRGGVDFSIGRGEAIQFSRIGPITGASTTRECGAVSCADDGHHGTNRAAASGSAATSADPRAGDGQARSGEYGRESKRLLRDNRQT